MPISAMANDRLPDSLPHSALLARCCEPTRPPAGPLPYESRARRDRGGGAPHDRARRLPDRLRRPGARPRRRASRCAPRRRATSGPRSRCSRSRPTCRRSHPIDSRNRGVGAAKKVVRKAVFFTVHHLTEQMRALGWATTSVGNAAAERIEQLEARVHELEARLARIEPDVRPRTRRSRDRGSPVPVDVRRSGRHRDAHAPAAQAAARRGLRVRHLRGRHARRRARRRHSTRRTFRDRVRGSVDPWILYHFSIGSPLFDLVRELDVPLALDYHNITDAKYFWRWEPRAATSMLEGRRQLAVAAPAVRFALADSEFNERELVALGLPAHRGRADPHRLRRLRHRPRRRAARPPRARPRARRRRLARGRSDRTQQVPARRAARVRGLPPGPRSRAPGSRSSAARAPGSTGARCTASPTISTSPTR